MAIFQVILVAVCCVALGIGQRSRPTKEDMERWRHEITNSYCVVSVERNVTEAKVVCEALFLEQRRRFEENADLEASYEAKVAILKICQAIRAHRGHEDIDRDMVSVCMELSDEFGFTTDPRLVQAGQAPPPRFVIDMKDDFCDGISRFNARFPRNKHAISWKQSCAKMTSNWGS